EEHVILVMTRLEGDPIADRLPKLGHAELDELSTQLATVLQQVRRIPVPGNGVCGFGGRPCRSYQMSFSVFGPFASLKGFNDWMYERTKWRRSSDGTYPPSRNEHERLILSHGDLTPHNILIDKEGRLTGVIDWECAGWMPAHW
ncbi:hypothetical protein CALCODRAFT_424070, partial [Calocera cornea HHB12733]